MKTPSLNIKVYYMDYRQLNLDFKFNNVFFTYLHSTSKMQENLQSTFKHHPPHPKRQMIRIINVMHKAGSDETARIRTQALTFTHLGCINTVFTLLALKSDDTNLIYNLCERSACARTVCVLGRTQWPLNLALVRQMRAHARFACEGRRSGH